MVPSTRCFAHFDLQMCFAPQRRAIFHLSSGQLAPPSLLFDPPEPQIIGKTQCFATFLPFHASASSFFLPFFLLIFSLLIFLFSLPLPCSAFHLSILSEVLTSKLPSLMLLPRLCLLLLPSSCKEHTVNLVPHAGYYWVGVSTEKAPRVTTLLRWCVRLGCNLIWEKTCDGVLSVCYTEKRIRETL